LKTCVWLTLACTHSRTSFGSQNTHFNHALFSVRYVHNIYNSTKKGNVGSHSFLILYVFYYCTFYIFFNIVSFFFCYHTVS
jgi:hypothetical protein